MKNLTASDLSGVMRRFYCEELKTLSPLLSEKETFHRDALTKFAAALEVVARSSNLELPLSEISIQKLFSWLRSRRNSGLCTNEGFSELKESAERELGEILGQENSKVLSLYLLFFREVTARFLLPEPVRFTLQNNQAAYQKVFGGVGPQVFDHYEHHRTLLSVYSASFADAFNSSDSTVLKMLDLDAKNILDAGGGSGGLGFALQKQGVQVSQYDLFDLPESEVALSSSRQLFYEQIQSPKSFVPGNFFVDDLENPTFVMQKLETYDFIFLTWILHDWDDVLCQKLLSNIKRLLKKNGRLVIIERLKDGPSHPFSAIYEFVMLLLAAGVERTMSEYTSLLCQSGFKLDSHIQQSGSRDFLVFSKI